MPAGAMFTGGAFFDAADRARDTYGSMQVRAAGFNARLGSTYMGRALRGGVQESFGFGTPGAAAGDFLGTKQSMGQISTRLHGTAPKSSVMFGQVTASPVKNVPRGSGAFMGRGSRGFFAKGIGKGIGASASLIGKSVFKAIPLIGTVAFGAIGYQEEGIWGMAKGAGESIAWSAGARALGPVGVAIAAIGYAGYTIGKAVGEAGIAHAKQVRGTEFGGGEKMIEALSSHGAATMRQRSLMALNNTHLNARMAMGNEALLLHTPFL